MSMKLITPAGVEPLDAGAVKQYLKVQTSDDDALIARLITSARQHVERLSGRCLIDQTWKVYLDSWPGSLQLELPLSPVSAINAVRFYSTDSTWHDVPASAWETDLSGDVPRLALASSALVGTPARRLAGIEIELVCGFGPTGDDVPEPLRQAMQMLIADWYSNRAESDSFVSRARNMSRVRALVKPYQVARL